MRIAVVCIAAVGLSACSDPSGVVELEGVSAEAQSTGLTIHNNRLSTIYTFIVDRDAAALISWLPCDDPATCPGVESDEQQNVSSSDIMGWGDSGEVIVHWWHLLPKIDGGFRPDSIRGMVVSL